ncbi:TIGR03826 family flagellar region protein [Paenibacillus guangzhouensis]|uniref:TIGR03826 family flagellar region protein n=1 Tax=Paenibacillus guangzhouensis TaxID=1473112 RepID=UPI0012675B67|nr:TIGR03826 family flagellar region protein [Paenibacillus guangzhouensis]
MNVENCPRCGRIFAKGIRDICPNCYRDIEDEYEICVKYLRENKEATMQVLSEETGVSVTQITKFLREGRISMKNAPNMSYPCESCSTPIREGHLCDTCRSRLTRDIKHLSEDERRREQQQHQNKDVHAYRVVDRFRDRE